MAKKSYSINFLNDFNWYLKMRHIFGFDGALDKYDVPFLSNGVDARKAFLKLDAQGKLVPTKHPNVLRSLIKTKGSINLHIKMYAEDRYNGLLPKVEFKQMCDEWDAPEWFSKAVENQKLKHLEQKGLFKFH